MHLFKPYENNKLSLWILLEIMNWRSLWMCFMICSFKSLTGNTIIVFTAWSHLVFIHLPLWLCGYGLSTLLSYPCFYHHRLSFVIIGLWSCCQTLKLGLLECWKLSPKDVFHVTCIHGCYPKLRFIVSTSKISLVLQTYVALKFSSIFGRFLFSISKFFQTHIQGTKQTSHSTLLSESLRFSLSCFCVSKNLACIGIGLFN